ncbi:YbjN domain-containing protein [Aureispira]|nr:YbjN domain-containing protein [Aureispira sp.]
MAILESQRQLINDAILSLGIDPEVCQQKEQPNSWKLHRGQTQIIIIAQESTNHKNDKIPTISMMAPILNLPKNFSQTEDLYQYVLAANHKLITESFSISNQWVILSSTYYIDDMRRQEIAQMLDALSFHAQSFASLLSDKFDFSN